MPNPMAEVFGYRPDDFSADAQRHRQFKLCPFFNKVPNCTKDKAKSPLGTCSLHDERAGVVITCPVRFRQDWLIAEHAAAFFFPPGTLWTSLTEVRLNDGHGRSAGNIDVVLVAYDDRGQVIDFGSLEIQSVYISGNIRSLFETYLANPEANHRLEEIDRRNLPRPDFLSSSRKRLAPQLIFKGSILKAWGKKQAVAVDRAFWQSLPTLVETPPADADLAWLIYDLVLDDSTGRYQLTLIHTAYTQFNPVLTRITTPDVGSIEAFITVLQDKISGRLDGEENPPDAPALGDVLLE